jgi:hypothetical protein
MKYTFWAISSLKRLAWIMEKKISENPIRMLAFWSAIRLS